MDNNLIVSIIVPVYNVEKYIGKCMESLINQTYKNIEILIINDGSPDNSIDVVKTFKDERIKIINQKNKGVSAARNNGLKHAHGKYIIFVDSDDYLSNDFVEYMLSLVKKNNSDFAFSTNNYKNNKETQVSIIKEETISSNNAVADLLSPDITVGCWNKIYNHNFLKDNNLLFSTDLFYGEGLQFIIECSKCAKRVSKTNKKIYYYRKNNDSSATTRFNIEKLYNGEKSLLLLKNKIDLKNERVKSMFILHLSTFYLGAIVKLIKNKKKKEYIEKYNYWRKQIQKNLGIILKSKYISLYRKLMLLCGCYFPIVVANLEIIRTKKIIKNSVK